MYKILPPIKQIWHMWFEPNIIPKRKYSTLKVNLPPPPQKKKKK